MSIRILIINPNTTQSMTEKISEAGKSAASSDVEIVLEIQIMVQPLSKAGRMDLLHYLVYLRK